MILCYSCEHWQRNSCDKLVPGAGNKTVCIVYVYVPGALG